MVPVAIVPLTSLWIPIILSAVIVFVASSVLHMVFKYHQKEYRQLPNEEKVLDALRPLGLTPGLYTFPYTTHQDMKLPATIEKFKQGPVGFISVLPSGQVNMGKFMGLWLGFCIVVSFFVAYLTGRTVASGTDYLAVFRVAGTAAFLAYGVGNLSNGIWHGLPWGMVLKEAFDGLIFALLTAGTFGWLWPR